MEINVIRKRNRVLLITFVVIAVLSVISMILTEFDGEKALTSIPKALYWMVTNFYPNKESLTKLPQILIKLRETIFLAIVSTTTASILALFFGLLGSEVTKINGVLTSISRFIASAFRNVPDVVWAMILLFSFGQNALTGYFALFFVSFGTLTRAFIESIDESSESIVEALESTGASFFQIVFQGIIPSVLPQLISWILFMIETNIRSSTLIGILTGTGIGFIFNLYYQGMNYSAAGLVVVSIVISVLVIESLSNYIRRAIL